ncbi:hypothetical protein PEPS_32290 (plasmid) [Persicobacter psychrovividus]|uniref:Uncharacterized protein n=1 Tax=Persicobacter psychrovividus TaxID=387638 RepID=A0ABN6LCP7_9BACT|nr:hypothetical protein PEPS_32290 [Persicobacter psychrovividus]
MAMATRLMVKEEQGLLEKAGLVIYFIASRECQTTVDIDVVT